MRTYRVTAEDRVTFLRCRRAWDLGAGERRHLEPLSASPVLDLGAALQQALAVYYYPGMWDWDRAVVNPLTHKGLAKALSSERQAMPAAGATSQPAQRALLDQGVAVMEAYLAWAPTVDAFSPIRVETEIDVNIPDPDPERTDTDADLMVPDRIATAVRYVCRLHLLAVDAQDRYWVVQHRVARDFADARDLLLEEEAVAQAWAWERAYPGMRIAGTMYNEVRIGALDDGMDTNGTVAAEPLPADASRHGWGLRQHEPSGGGRGPGQHRRLYLHTPAEVDPSALGQPVVLGTTTRFRRTQIQRSAAAVQSMGARIAEEAAEMIQPTLPLYPTPTPMHCRGCAFVTPCLAMTAGIDPTPILDEEFRVGSDDVTEGRLGGRTWGVGRGGAPPPSWRGR
ncbi:MAG: hypothetical protein ACR2HR_13570 [Euzebya sp.]